MLLTWSPVFGPNLGTDFTRIPPEIENELTPNVRALIDAFFAQAGDFDTQRVTNGEVAGGQLPRLVDLRDEDFFGRSVFGAPLRHTPFESPPCGIRECSRVHILQPLKERERPQPRLLLKSLLHDFPNVRERNNARPVVTFRAFRTSRIAYVFVVIFACRFRSITAILAASLSECPASRHRRICLTCPSFIIANPRVLLRICDCFNSPQRGELYLPPGATQ
ncbi:MAG: hypothetical protein AAFN70_07375 [Planctomycetota bacterium]